MEISKHFLRMFGMATAMILLLSTAGCKSTMAQKKAPFSISEKSYHEWIGGKEGTRGKTITLRGYTQTLNLSISKIFFQNHEYDVVPSFNGNDFVLSATMSEFYQTDKVMSGDPRAEYGNKPPELQKKIPFDLEDDEAVLLYSVNGQESYHKVSGIKKADTVYRP